MNTVTDAPPKTRYRLRFSGIAWLDRSDPRDVALFESLAAGQQTTLTVDVTSIKSASSPTFDREGNLVELTEERAARVESAIAAPE